MSARRTATIRSTPRSAREDGDARGLPGGLPSAFPFRSSTRAARAAGRSGSPPRRSQEIRRRSGPAKFESQMLLRPRSVEDIRLDPALLVRYDAPLELREANGESVLSLSGRRLVSASCWWDPAYGAPDIGDASVVAAVFVDEAGAYWLHDIRYLNHDPAQRHEVDEATQLCRQVAAFVQGPVPALGHDRDQWPGPFPAGPAPAGAAGARARLSGARACVHEQQGAADSASVRSAAGGRSTSCPRRRLGVALHRRDARMAPQAALPRRRSRRRERVPARRTGPAPQDRTGQAPGLASGTIASHGDHRLRPVIGASLPFAQARCHRDQAALHDREEIR